MKITKYILSFAAAAGLLAACQTPEIVQIASPENVVPASLHELDIDEIAISATNQQETVSFSWEAADYGAPTQVTYSLEAALDETSDKVAILSGLAKTGAVVTYEDLNRVLFNDLQVPEGQPTELKFYVGSILSAGSSISSYPKVYSEPITITVTVTAAEKVYPKVWVIGDYCGWSHDKTQFLFDFAGDDKVYQGVVDFGEKAANGWKITGVAGWDDTCNWGGDETATYDPEAATTQLINGGGSKDLKHYSKRFYHFSLEKGTLLLTKTIGFDNIGVVGSFNGWSEVNNVEMSFNASKQRFYADVEFAEDAEFKFNIDKAWAVSFGVGANGFLTSQDGANITAKAGNYRVYLNMNNYGEITYELSKGMYGQDEPTSGTTTPDTPDTPTPPVMSGWGIVGSITNWGNLTSENTYIPDVALANDGTWYVAKGVEIPAGAEIKFRKDGAWDSQWGLGADPFAANTEMTLSSDGGSGNITPAAGTYDIYLNPETGKAWFINDGSYPGGAAAPEASEWGVVGQINNWGATADIVMYKTATEGLFVAYKVEMPEGPFKIRANNEWNDEKNYGLATAGNVEVDHVYDVITSGGSGNMTVAAGTYDIWFDLTNSKVYIMTPGKPISEAVGGEVVVPDPTEQTWYMVGNFNNWNPADDAYKMTAEAEYFVFKNFVAAKGCEAKFAPGAWNGDKGIDGAFAANTACNTGSGNIPVAEGTYDVYLAKDLSKFYFMTAGYTPGQTPTPDPTPDPEPDPTPDPEPEADPWYLVGDFNGWTAADPTYKLTKTGDWYVFKNFTANGKGVKFVADAAWSVNRGGSFSGVGKKVYLAHNGADMLVTAGTYDVYLSADASFAFFVNPGETPNDTPEPEDSPNTIYLNTGGSSLWDQGSAWFEAWSWGATDGQWIKLEAAGNGIYKCVVPEGNNNIIFVRRGPSMTSGWTEGTHYWNKTDDLTIPSGKNCYTITGWGGKDGNWSTK